MIKIEFFHDVICSFCFPMSATMRKIAHKYNNLEIIHRSFALGWEEEDFIRSFGSRQGVKEEVLSHWKHANQIDENHRFNIEGMRGTDFKFPLSKNALIAAKAAGIKFGQEAYWQVFDQLQAKLFMDNQNIESKDVIESGVKECQIDFDPWQEQFLASETEAAVLADIQRAHSYGVYSAPTLIIQEKYRLSGAQPFETIEAALQNIAAEEQISLNKMTDLAGNYGPSCTIVDGHVSCNS